MATLDEEIQAMQVAAMGKRLRPQDAAELFRVTRVTIYNWMNDPDADFPQPKRRNKRHVYWTEFDLREWAARKGYDLSPLH